MEQHENFKIGDIVWAKIGRYPFWPSIVCNDPDSKIYKKGSPKEKKKFSLHVRFCNDNGRRSWVKTFENYYGKEKLLSKYPNCLAFLKNSKKQMSVWNLAVKEAEGWLKFDREERCKKFLIVYNINTSPNTPSKSNASPSASTSKSSSDDTNKTKNDIACATHNVPSCYIYLQKLSDVQTQKAVPKMEVKKNTCPTDINDDEVSSTPTPRKRRYRLPSDVAKLEAEGLRKIREFNASKLAKASGASITIAPPSINNK